MKKKKGDPIKLSVDRLNKEFEKLEKELPKPLSVEPDLQVDRAAKVIYMTKKVAEQSISNLESNVKEVQSFLARNTEPITVGLFVGGLVAILYKSVKEALRREAI